MKEPYGAMNQSGVLYQKHSEKGKDEEREEKGGGESRKKKREMSRQNNKRKTKERNGSWAESKTPASFGPSL